MFDHFVKALHQHNIQKIATKLKGFMMTESYENKGKVMKSWNTHPALL